jgi:AGCS family alanine or glycine:cation symporter
MKSNRLISCIIAIISSPLSASGIDASINAAVQPITNLLSSFIFYEVEIFGASMPLIVLWLIGAAIFFTGYFNFLNLRGFKHAFKLLRGDYSRPDNEGELTHFQALSTAVSGTVGIGNIAGVAIVISIGGPGATFWLIVAGLLGMSTKFAECVAGVMYRKVNTDGSISGGPMYYLEAGLHQKNLSWLAKPMGLFYAIAIVVGCLGIGNMFQSNQAFQQFIFITGGEASYFVDKGWLFGSILAGIVGLVIIGGIKGIARVTSKLVPFMTLTYVVGALLVIVMNAERVPWAISAILTEAFNPSAMSGGMLGIMILGFQRAAFSNEAGIGSAAIAHATVKTQEPVTEGYVGLMEPFIDTVIICTLTAFGNFNHSLRACNGKSRNSRYCFDLSSFQQHIKLVGDSPIIYCNIICIFNNPVLVILWLERLDIYCWRICMGRKYLQNIFLYFYSPRLHD